MYSIKSGLVAALAIGGALATGAAQARGGDVQWSVTVGTPAVQWHVASPVARVVVPVPVYPRYIYHASGHRHGYGDRDRDGIPNRYDRVYNPRWDIDGDGIPNRRDRVYNPRWDRDGDGIPNRYDRHPGRR